MEMTRILRCGEPETVRQRLVSQRRVRNQVDDSESGPPLLGILVMTQHDDSESGPPRLAIRTALHSSSQDPLARSKVG